MQTKITIHDIKQAEIENRIDELCAFIRCHDASYGRNLEQADRAIEIVSNLTRYANSIQEKLPS